MQAAGPTTTGFRESNLARPGARIGVVPFVAYPLPPHDPALDVVAAAIDPVVSPLGFASGSLGCSGDRAQVTFCRGLLGSIDGACVDLVVELEAVPDWRIIAVRYWGFPVERWHLRLPAGRDLTDQLEQLRQTLPHDLADA